MMESDPSLPSALYKWACSEMGLITESYSNESSPVTAFPSKSADWHGICLGPMTDIWNYVISHVKPVKSVGMIKGNLKLHSTHSAHNDDNIKSILVKKNKLQQEVLDLENQNKKLYDQLTHNRSKVALKKRHITQYQSLARDHKRSCFILNILTSRIQCQISSLKDSFWASEAKIHSFIPFRDLEGNEDRYKIDVCKMSKLMQESLAELTTENPSLEKIQTLKHEVGCCLATLLCRLSHPHFLQLLRECQEADMNKTSQLISTKGKMVDICDVEFIIQSANSVQDLVSSLSWFCVDQFNSSEKKGKLVESLKKKLLLSNLDIQQQLEKLFQGREELLNVARELVNLRIKYDSYEATLMALKKSSLDLRERCCIKEVNRDEIKSTKAQIEKNNYQMEHYSTLICTLAKKHAENSTLVNREVTDLKCLLINKAPILRGSLVSAAESTRKSLEKQETFFNTFRSSKFLHSQVESELVPIESLATNRLRHLNEARVSDSTISSFLEILNIKPYISTFQLHRTIGAITSDILRMRQAVKWYNTMMSEIVEKHKYSPFSEKSVHGLGKKKIT